jgi:hypothetical protein
MKPLTLDVKTGATKTLYCVLVLVVVVTVVLDAITVLFLLLLEVGEEDELAADPVFSFPLTSPSLSGGSATNECLTIVLNLSP